VKINKILVVDDDPFVLQSCRKILEAEGFKVTAVASAREAIETLELNYADLMITDIKMPEQDGFYLLGKIREKWPLASWPELPVLVMTGYPTPETLRQLKRSGVRKFIPKPFTPDELIAAVRKLGERSVPDEPR
jgi:CheY-like chemotaxis protein